MPDTQEKLNVALLAATIVLLVATLVCPYDQWSVVERQLRQPTDRNSTTTNAPVERLYIGLWSIDLCLDEVGCRHVTDASYQCLETQTFWTASVVLLFCALLDSLAHFLVDDFRTTFCIAVGQCLPRAVSRMVCGCQAKLVYAATVVWLASLILVVNLAEWTTVCTLRVAPASQYVMLSQKTLPAQRWLLGLAGAGLAVTCAYLLYASHLCCSASYGSIDTRHAPYPPSAHSSHDVERHQLVMAGGKAATASEASDFERSVGVGGTSV